MLRRVDFIGSGYECVRFVMVDTDTTAGAIEEAKKWYVKTGQDFHYIGMEISKEYAYNESSSKLSFVMVDGGRVDVSDARIVVAFANPDYDAAEPYKVFEQELPENNVCSYYTFATPEEFINKWYEMVENPDGMWYWVIDNEFEYVTRENGRALIVSGACDPEDIEIFKEHWVLDEQLSRDFFEDVQVVSALSEEQQNEAIRLLGTCTYLDMEEGQLELVAAYEVEQYKPKVDKLFDIGWPAARIGDKIHEWWSDYQMSDDTETVLLTYVEQKGKEHVQGKAPIYGPQAVEAMNLFKEQAVAEIAESHDPSLVPPFVPKWEEIANKSRLNMPNADKPILDHSIEFEEKYEGAENESTTFYFKAPKEMLETLRIGSYPDAVGMEISIEFPSNHIEPAYADICVSPTNAEGSDYDWTDIDLPYEEIEALIDLANKSMNKGSLTVAVLIDDAVGRSGAASSKLSDREIEKLWESLEDVPIDEEECLDVDWNGWPKGTHREEIWHWFDEHHSKGVGWLMNEYEPSNDVEIEKG